MGLFDILLAAPYEERMIARWSNDDDDDPQVVSTAAVNDGILPIETAICHPDYHGGAFIIVQAYSNKAAAFDGHARWVELMIADTLPDPVVDCANYEGAQLLEELSDKVTSYPRVKLPKR